MRVLVHSTAHHLSRLARALLPWVSIVAGGVISSYGYAALIMPNGMLEGGVLGLGFLARRLFGLPAGTTAMVLSLVVFAAGLKILGRGFGLRTVVGVAVASLSLDLFTEVLAVQPLTDDPILAAFYGGAICGLGLAMVYAWGAATGGSDALAQIVLKLWQVPVGRTLLVVDAAVLGAAIFVYGPEKVMVSMLMIFVEIKVIDLILVGAKASQRVLIVSRRHDEIRARILNELGRGVTTYDAHGGYSGEPREVIATVAPRRTLPALRRLVNEVDPDAFMVVQDVRQVFGRGFDALPPPAPISATLGRKAS
jgi:uncharacterized membrane-anchored protein YitT (DUF2179 family)